MTQLPGLITPSVVYATWALGEQLSVRLDEIIAGRPDVRIERRQRLGGSGRRGSHGRQRRPPKQNSPVYKPYFLLNSESD